jgi:hypothetical protein
MTKASRRQFLTGTGSLFVSAAALSPLSALAFEQDQQSGKEEGIIVNASLQNRCATCQYWGGMRRLNQDKSLVIAQSMGWCNNPDSAKYQKLTEADNHMMKPEIWVKWPAI